MINLLKKATVAIIVTAYILIITGLLCYGFLYILAVL